MIASLNCVISIYFLTLPRSNGSLLVSKKNPKADN